MQGFQFLAVLVSTSYLVSCGGSEDSKPIVDNSNMDIYVGTWYPDVWYGDCGRSVVSVLDSSGQSIGLADQSYSFQIEKAPGKTDELKATLKTTFYMPNVVYPNCTGAVLGSQSLPDVAINLTKETQSVTDYFGTILHTVQHAHMSSPGFQGRSSASAGAYTLSFPPDYFNTAIDYDLGVSVPSANTLFAGPWSKPKDLYFFKFRKL